ncbi:MAG: NADH-quinone oxidoreductase subunit NuoE [Acidobacteria bacterium]|jgi:NADH-quinone oxidoreductase subunit E|nr:NADH-quinone oxidoreductase subunit NuoE [Thermoanaerobaculia bacterium]MBP7814184.1 NADH-quinone oxidoreductase subunit NuoE [Thermoanaerobaculia bacterium]MBP8845070.1 NADH-quinone oxidoreductase subunit NuoE [Thermoanaerobaculia bacterium]NLN10739.1 NADH-quinone oxidoreductase subunit NuoE [Acidobacteriota bacterium]OQC41625.1 MAG: NADP-reducing hydrogenase subunit HndA [Acidobacteria bacterium ADurb.Bin051]
MSSVPVETGTRIDELLAPWKGARREALIPILQEVQEACGYLPQEAIVRVSRHLDLPTSKVYGVATFYNQFRFQPPGRNQILVCRGTACHVKGSAAVLEAICDELQIRPGQTTRDGMFSVDVVACIGACGLAPVISINGAFFAGVTPEGVPAILESFRQKEAARA